MATQIQDGTGSKFKLKINGENRAEVQAIILDQEDDAIAKGEGYQIATGPIVWSGAATQTGVLYVKNNADTDFILDRAVLILGTVTGAAATEDWTFQTLRNPTAGTTIDNASPAGISNSNHGSANTPNIDAFKFSAIGDTLTDGTGAPLPIQQASNRTIYPLGRRLPKGSSVGFRLTPPASTTSATAVLVLHMYYGFNI